MSFWENYLKAKSKIREQRVKREKLGDKRRKQGNKNQNKTSYLSFYKASLSMSPLALSFYHKVFSFLINLNK